MNVFFIWMMQEMSFTHILQIWWHLIPLFHNLTSFLIFVFLDFSSSPGIELQLYLLYNMPFLKMELDFEIFCEVSHIEMDQFDHEKGWPQMWGLTNRSISVLTIALQWLELAYSLITSSIGSNKGS